LEIQKEMNRITVVDPEISKRAPVSEKGPTPEKSQKIQVFSV
jgi:hypothetical protein